jgi:hypothetical protein
MTTLQVRKIIKFSLKKMNLKYLFLDLESATDRSANLVTHPQHISTPPTYEEANSQ